MEMANKPVVVCTEHRGVFFGYIEDCTLDRSIVTLTNAKMALRWSSDVNGVLGLSSVGPSADCKISNRSPRIVLRKVTAIMDCDPSAAEKWESK
jgi:hypothetical protein